MESTPQAVFPALLRNEKRFSLQTWPLFSLINESQFALLNLKIDLSMLQGRVATNLENMENSGKMYSIYLFCLVFIGDKFQNTLEISGNLVSQKCGHPARVMDCIKEVHK